MFQSTLCVNHLGTTLTFYPLLQLTHRKESDNAYTYDALLQEGEKVDCTGDFSAAYLL